ncbi:MAG: AbfB domain-containing protein [Chloroflexota bacterium]
MQKMISTTVRLLIAIVLCLPATTASAEALSRQNQTMEAQASPVVGKALVTYVEADADMLLLDFDGFLYYDFFDIEVDDEDFGIFAGEEHDQIVLEGPTGLAVITWKTDSPELQDALMGTYTEVMGLGSPDDNTLLFGDTIDIRVQEADNGLLDVTFDIYRGDTSAGTFSFLVEGMMPGTTEGGEDAEQEEVFRGTVADVNQIVDMLPPLMDGDTASIFATETADGGTELAFTIYRNNQVVSTFVLTQGGEDSALPNLPISLESVNYPERHLIVEADGSAIKLLPITAASTDEQKQRAEFLVVPGLADPDMVSLQVNNASGAYVVATPDGVTLQGPDSIGNFLAEATFNVLDGLAGVGISFESLAYPEHYLRHSNSVLQLNASDDSQLFMEDASFNDVMPVGVLEPAKGTLRVVSSKSEDEGSTISMHEDASVELIMDASGSMSGQPLDTAKQTLSDLVTNVLPDDVPTALRVFGHSPDVDCFTNLEVPLGTLDRSGMNDTIMSMQALGSTPIAQALAQVPSDLANAEGHLLVVLVTDGGENCGGDPLKEITNLVNTGVDVRVNIVGFAIDNAALKQQFEDWAAAGNGRYFDAPESDQLGAALQQALSVHYTVYDANGNEIGQGVVDGPAIELDAGVYTVQLSNQQQDTFTVEVVGDEEICVDLSTLGLGVEENIPSTVQGQVTDATSGDPIADAEVCLVESGQCAITDSSGNYVIADVAAGDYTFEVAATGYTSVAQQLTVASGELLTQNAALSPELASGELRIVLEWGENPSDLDSYLRLPSQDTISYSNQGGGSAQLDLDDQNGYGPETITISQLEDGTYAYAVHHYAGKGSLATSGAIVRIYGQTGLVKEYTPTAGQDERWWYVFDLDGSGNIVDVNTLQADAPQ